MVNTCDEIRGYNESLVVIVHLRKYIFEIRTPMNKEKESGG